MEHGVWVSIRSGFESHTECEQSAMTAMDGHWGAYVLSNPGSRMDANKQVTLAG